MNGLHGNPGDPIVVKGYRNERPVLDGTIEIIPTTAWTNKGAGKIYRYLHRFYNDCITCLKKVGCSSSPNDNNNSGNDKRDDKNKTIRKIKFTETVAFILYINLYLPILLL